MSQNSQKQESVCSQALDFPTPTCRIFSPPPLGASALCRQALRSLGLRGLGPREKRAIMRRTRQSDTARGGTPWEEGGTMDAHHGISRRHVLGLAMAVGSLAMAGDV